MRLDNDISIGRVIIKLPIFRILKFKLNFILLKLSMSFEFIILHLHLNWPSN